MRSSTTPPFSAQHRVYRACTGTPLHTRCVQSSDKINEEITVTTPTLRLTDASVTTATVDAVVVGTMSGEGGPRLLPGSAEVDAAFDGALSDLLAMLGARGKAEIGRASCRERG